MAALLAFLVPDVVAAMIVAETKGTFCVLFGVMRGVESGKRMARMLMNDATMSLRLVV